MKYWNKAQIRREKERRLRLEERELEISHEEERRKKTYTRGDTQKNTALMLEALGSKVNRKMLARLRSGGAMSITHLAEPFRITLPAAVVRVNALERADLIRTEKRGRIRFCINNVAGIKELSMYLASSNPFGGAGR